MDNIHTACPDLPHGLGLRKSQNPHIHGRHTPCPDILHGMGLITLQISHMHMHSIKIRRGPRPKAGLRGVTLDVRGGIPHLSKAGLRVPLGAAKLFRVRDRGLWSHPRPPGPTGREALSPRAVEETTARGRLRGAKRDHL